MLRNSFNCLASGQNSKSMAKVLKVYVVVFQDVLGNADDIVPTNVAILVTTTKARGFQTAVSVRQGAADSFEQGVEGHCVPARVFSPSFQQVTPLSPIRRASIAFFRSARLRASIN